jgi:TetR/AcrR family transcriptional regulator
MDVRSEILRVATRLFASRGFDATSLGAIAGEVGVAKPSLLYHFPSKNDLRLAVLDQLLEHWNDVLPRLLMASMGGEPRFDTLMREVLDFFTADPDRARLLVREVLDRPDDMRRRLESHVRPWVRLVADYIEKGQASGEVHPEVDAEAWTLQIINMVVCGVVTASSLEGGLLPRDDDHEEPAARHARELMRIARVSLFTREKKAARKAQAV